MAENKVSDDILASLKVNNKGWNTQLFADQNIIQSYICTHCQSVCCDAVELGCDHDDDDIFLYCKLCLQSLIQTNHNQCPINNHKHPLISSNRASRRHISKLRVVCPHSESFKLNNMALFNEAVLAPIMDDGGNNDIHDNDEDDHDDDEKEGALYKQPGSTPPNHRCEWKGTLSDLINHHIVSCTLQNDPSFRLKLKIKNLERQNEELQNRVFHQHRVIEQQQNEIDNLKTKHQSIQQLNQQKDAKIERLKQMANEAYEDNHRMACQLVKYKEKFMQIRQIQENNPIHKFLGYWQYTKPPNHPST